MRICCPKSDRRRCSISLNHRCLLRRVAEPCGVCLVRNVGSEGTGRRDRGMLGFRKTNPCAALVHMEGGFVAACIHDMRSAEQVFHHAEQVFHHAEVFSDPRRFPLGHGRLGR